MASTFQFKDIVSGFQTALKDKPEQSVATFTATSRQVSGLKSEVAIRGFKIIVDEPPSLAGTDEGPNPAELALAALASCQEITYRLYADKLGVPVDAISVKLDGDIDLRGFFAVDANVRPGFTEIRGTVTIESPASTADIARLRATVDAHCPILDLLSRATPIKLEVSQTTLKKAAA
jgi:uncharacterized OsmC-like protein